MKALILIMVLAFTFTLAGGYMVYIDGEGNVIQPDDGKVIRPSSYQVLKIKYESEVDYSNELKDRILVLQKEKFESDMNLSECLSSTPLIIQNDPVVKVEDYIFWAVFGFFIGKLF